MSSQFENIGQLREALLPKAEYGQGEWIDMAGMIAPKEAVTDLLADMEQGRISDVEQVNKAFAGIHDSYYAYEWRWAYDAIRDYYGFDLATADVEQLVSVIERWKESVVGLDNLIYDDARKEFSLSAMTSFGVDGDEADRRSDFEQVRGAFFEADPFVQSVKEHIKVKSALGDSVLAKLREI